MVSAALALFTACTQKPADSATPSCNASDPWCTVTLKPTGTPSQVTVNGAAVPVTPWNARPARVLAGICPNAPENSFTRPDGTPASYIASEIWFQRAAPSQWLYGEGRPVVLCSDRMQRLDPETGAVETILTSDEEALDAQLEGGYGEPILWAGLYGSELVGGEDAVLYPFQGASQIGVASISWADGTTEILADAAIPAGADITDAVPATGGVHFLPIVEDSYQQNESDEDWYYRPFAYSYYDQEASTFSAVLSLPELPDLTDEVTEDGVAFAELSDSLMPYFRNPTVVGDAVWLPFGASLMDDEHYGENTAQIILRYDLASGEELASIDLNGLAFGVTNLVDAPLREIEGTEMVVGITQVEDETFFVYFDHDGNIVKTQGLGDVDANNSDPAYSYEFLSQDGRRAQILSEFSLGVLYEYDPDLFQDDDRLVDTEQFVEDPQSQRYTVFTGHARDYVVVDTQGLAAGGLTLENPEPCYRYPLEFFGEIYYDSTCPGEAGIYSYYHPVTTLQDKLLIGYGTDVLVYDLPE
jgi:hypothetical protein